MTRLPQMMLGRLFSVHALATGNRWTFRSQMRRAPESKKAYRLDRRVCYLIGICCAIAFTSDVQADAVMSDAFQSVARSSLVRINLEKLDLYKNPMVGNQATGHGVYISPDGVLLTAAHVVLPMKNLLGSARSYRLVIESWDDEEGKWRKTHEIKSGELANFLVYHEKLPLEIVYFEHGEPMPVLTDTPNREIDFAFLDLSGRNAKNHGYVDIMGPFDSLVKEPLSEYPTFVFSGFAPSPVPRGAPVTMVHPSDRSSFYTDTVNMFRKGISGSPLVVNAKSDRKDALYLAGIVVEEFHPDANLTPSELYNYFKVVLLEEFAPAHLQKLEVRLPQRTMIACKNGLQPYEQPLMNDYLLASKPGVGESEFKTMLDCLNDHNGWVKTAFFIELKRMSAEGLQAVRRDYYAKMSPPKSDIGAIRSLLEDAKIDREIKSILKSAYEAKIDPVQFFSYVRDTGSSVDSDYATAIIRYIELARKKPTLFYAVQQQDRSRLGGVILKEEMKNFPR
jgi:hypothetical protein